MTESDIFSLVHEKLDAPIEIRCGAPTVLCIESADEFYRLVSELVSQYSGGNGDFVLLRNGEFVPLDKTTEFVHDVFSIGSDDKKTINLLHKELIAFTKDSELLPLQCEVNGAIAKFYEALFEKVSLPLTYDEPEISDILKLGNIKPGIVEERLIEKIISYINTSIEIKKKSVFIFVNLKKSLRNEDAVELYKHCELEKAGLLLIESCAQSERISGEKRITITDDLCEIIDTDI